METLGVWLRQTREARDETLREAEAATRIRFRFLKMLEEAEFDAFPGGEVQVRGFLRIYARHLELSPDEVVARYDKEIRRVEPVPVPAPVVTPPVHPAPSVPSAPAPPPPRPVIKPTPAKPGQPSPLPAMPQWLSLETLIIACIVLIILLVVVIAAMVVVSRGAGSEEMVPTVVAPAATSGGVLTLSTPTPTPLAVTPTFPADPGGYVMLSLNATEHVWVRVSVDGRTAFEGTLGTGQTETWSGREEIVVETGNGAGLQVTVNGQLQGAMCGRGQACVRSWEPTGEITP